MAADTGRLLSDIVAKPGYGSHVVGAIARVPSAATPNDALELLRAAKAAMGVEQAVFVSYIRKEDAHETYRFMLDADPRWCFEYQASAWYASDPWLLYASMNEDVIRASEIPLLTAQQRTVHALAEKYGMVSTCIAPTASHGTNARVGMLAMGSARRGFVDTDAFAVFRVLARSLAMELHQWWNRYERNETIAKLQLTDPDLRLLRLELEGGGTKRTASELGMSAAAINSRWQRLNRKLGSPHRHATARLATKYGLT